MTNNELTQNLRKRGHFCEPFRYHFCDPKRFVKVTPQTCFHHSKIAISKGTGRGAYGVIFTHQNESQKWPQMILNLHWKIQKQTRPNRRDEFTGATDLDLRGGFSNFTWIFPTINLSLQKLTDDNLCITHNNSLTSIRQRTSDHIAGNLDPKWW